MAQFHEFGTALKAFRIATNKSVEDVSGAVEIEPANLKQIEAGKILPEEDILSLIISHLALRDSEAERLYSLAGINKPSVESTKNTEKPEVVDIVLDQELPVVYTDMVHISSNEFGLIMNFIQRFDGSQKGAVVARVGMSKEHAKSMIDILQKTISRVDSSEQG